jgi:hypothetical protein
MEDYEVRDVMSRKTHPRIRASVFINRDRHPTRPEGYVLVKLENVGRVLAHHVMVEMEVPIDIKGLISIDKPVIMKSSDEGDCYAFRLTPGEAESPIFPGSDLTLKRLIHTNARILQHYTGRPPASTHHVKVSVFVDEMIPLRAVLEVDPVIQGWTLVGNATLLE